MKVIWTMMFTFLSICLATATEGGQEKFEALFLYKFCDYIKWPEENTQRIVGIYGNPKVLKELTAVASSSGKIVVRQLNDLSEAKDCDIVYVGHLVNPDLTGFKSTAKAHNILVVTENDDLVHQGSCIGFYTEGGRLKFALRKSTVEAYNLKVSSTLMSLAKIVK